MATEQQLMEGIRRADAAGDSDGVKALGAALLQMRGQAPAQTSGPQAKPKERSFLGDLGAATTNALAGFAQGITSIPDAATNAMAGAMRYGVQGAAAVGAGGARALGYPGAANRIEAGAQNIDRQLSHPVTLGGVVENISPAPQDGAGSAARMGAQFLGGMVSPANAMLPKPVVRAKFPQAADTSAQDIIRAGKQSGVRVLTTDVKPPHTFVGKTAQATGERIIGTGTGAVRQAQNAERIAAVKQLALDHGIIDDATGAGMSDAVAADLARTRGAALTKLAAAKNAVIDAGMQAIETPRTVSAIDQQIAHLQSIGTDATKPVIAKLQDWRQAIQGKNLPVIEAIRKEMGAAFSAPELSASRDTGEKALSAIYGPLRSDMGDAIKATQGPEAFARWKGANDQLSAMAGDLGNRAFKGILRDAESTPENVAKALFSKKPSDISRLMSNLSPQGQVRARSAVIYKALENSGGLENVSPDRFANAIGKLGRSAGVIFQPEEAAQLQGLGKLLNATKRASQAGAAPPTGVQNAMAGVYGGAGALGGIKGLLAVQGYGLLARAYESAAVRDLLVRLGSTAKGGASEAALLEKTAAAIAAMQPRAPAMTGLNDNAMIGLAADPGAKKQQK